MIEEKYLPLGSTVILKNVEDTEVVIVGFCVSNSETKEQVWDYVGFIYPYGMTTHSVYFNHDDITKVIQLGYVNEKYKNFNKELKESINSAAIDVMV